MAHQKRSQVATWSNDIKAEKAKNKPTDDYLNFDSDESESLSEEEEEHQDVGITPGNDYVSLHELFTLPIKMYFPLWKIGIQYTPS